LRLRRFAGASGVSLAHPPARGVRLSGCGVHSQHGVGDPGALKSLCAGRGSDRIASGVLTRAKFVPFPDYQSVWLIPDLSNHWYEA
jgi:hypothetical protein